MNDDEQLSGTGRLVVGALFVAAGIVPILAGFDLGPLRQTDIHGPPWLAVVAGGIFLLAGLSIVAGERVRHGPFAYVMSFLIFAGFAAIGNWIALGVGERNCSGSVSALFFTSSRDVAGLECRIAFGLGALMLDGMLIWMFAAGLRKVMGPGPVLDRVEKAGQAVLLLALAPILLPLLLIVVGKSLFEACREYRKTGKWPRNEAFSKRMKKKRHNPSAPAVSANDLKEK